MSVRIHTRRAIASQPAPAGDPRWARPALAGLLALTALLYLINLSRNGWANDFYAAAVQSGTRSWKAFFFGSFDASSFITVDKTPASLWVMELSGRIFGFSSWSMLAPQALEGVASVALLYAAVKRWSGRAAGLAAGLVLALTPVAAVMFRFDNPDALLVLLMTAAAYALVRAIENGRSRWLVLCGLLLGFAFLAKMLQAFLVVPGFAVAYLWAAPPRLGKRLLQLLAAGLGIVLGAGWWVLAVQLTPAADRPYVGGSTDNNILQLALGYNGLDRLTGATQSADIQMFQSKFGSNLGGGATGVFRLFEAEFGGQISWLLPAALIALTVLLWVSRRAPRTDRTRAAALIWGGWVLVTGAVFSCLSGIIHPYYMVALAPGIAALTGIGAATVWRMRPGPASRTVAAVGVAASAWWAWVLLDRTPHWFPWLRWAVVLAGTAAAVALLARPGLAATRRALICALAGFAMIAGAAAFTLASVNTTYLGAIPVAGPQSPAAVTTANFYGSTQVNGALVRLLGYDAGRYRWVAATVGAFAAAPLEMTTGDPVIAIGGYPGTDPWPTLAVFKGLVARHEVHYYFAYAAPRFITGGPGAAIAPWVAAHFPKQTIAGETVYNLTQPAGRAG